MLCVNMNWHPAATLQHLKHICDAVVSLSSVTDASDLAQMVTDSTSLVSLLRIEKFPSLGTMTPANKTDDLFAVRSGRKRWTVRPIEIDPAKEAQIGHMDNPPCHNEPF